MPALLCGVDVTSANVGMSVGGAEEDGDGALQAARMLNSPRTDKMRRIFVNMSKFSDTDNSYGGIRR